MPPWIPWLLREETPLPMPEVDSATMTSWPASAAARATASPTTPAPITRICIAVSSPDQVADNSLKSVFLAAEAANCGAEDGRRPQTAKVQRMAGPFSKKSQEGQLRPAVALSKRVNSIQLSEEMR